MPTQVDLVMVLSILPQSVYCDPFAIPIVAAATQPTDVNNKKRVYGNNKVTPVSGGSKAAEGSIGSANVVGGTNAPAKEHAATDDKLMEVCNDDFRTDEGTPEWNFEAMLEAGQRYLDHGDFRTDGDTIEWDFKNMMEAKSMETCDEDFRTDGDTTEWDFKKMLEDGQRYLDSFGADSLLPRVKTHGVYLPPEYLSVMANSDIGLGTDPERSEEHILNKKERILVPRLFPTYLFYPGKPEPFETVHTITEESQLLNGKKIDFGIAGGFEGVQLGFEKVNEFSDWSHSRRVVAIADLRYQCAKTESRIHCDKLYKFVTDDCKVALRKINDEEVVGLGYSAVLAGELSRFIEKYGTHVVLKCTHGYRMEKVERWDVSNAESLENFKAGILASVLDYAGANAERLQHTLGAAKRTESSLGIKNIGSKVHIKEAIEAGMNFDEMMRYSGKQGDAGVISHDWNMMIADMLLAEGSPYKLAGRRLRYWTNERIDDLKAGWGEGLFATSYELKFTRIHTDAGPMKKMKNFFWKQKHREHTLACKKGVRITIGGLTFHHQHPGNDTECRVSHVTNIHTNDAKSIFVSALDDSVALKDVLEEITVFNRLVSGDGIEGLVLASTLKTSFMSEYAFYTDLFDIVPGYGILTTVDVEQPSVPKEVFSSKYLEIGIARAKVCRQN